MKPLWRPVLFAFGGAVAAAAPNALDGAPAPSAVDHADCQDWNTRTFFRTALSRDIKACLASGADPNAKGEYGRTPLHHAGMYSQSPEVIHSLVAAGADPAAQGESVSTPITWAACNPNPEMAAALIVAGADPGGRDELFGATPLHAAAVCGNAAVIQTLVEAGADPNAPDDWGWPPLHCAGHCPRERREFDYAHHRDAAVTEALIAMGADPDLPTPDGKTPLHHAARGNSNAAVIETLAAAGADPNARDSDGQTPLHSAARFNYSAVIEALVEAGADPAAQDRLFGRTPLHYVLRRPRNAEVLLASGASINAPDSRDRTPLHTVANLMIWKEGADVLRTLISHGARIDARDADGYTPLDLAKLTSTAHAAAAIDVLVEAESAGHAEPTHEALVEDLRIGFLIASGQILVPIDTVDDPHARFTDSGWYRERDRRRRDWMRRLEANPQALLEAPLRLAIGEQVTVLHAGSAYPAVVDGFGSLAAGCGETEPAWTLEVRNLRDSDPTHDTSHQHDDEAAGPESYGQEGARLSNPGLWHGTDWDREHSPTPVLVHLGTDQTVQPPTLAVDVELPAGLLARLAAADLLKGENRALRAGPVWAVYGARTFDRQRRPVGAIRSIWIESDGTYHLRHRATSNPSFEGMLKGHMDPERRAFRARSFVGQIHAASAHAGQLFLLTRIQGWESHLVSLRQLGDGTLDPVLIDGLDRGC